MKVAAIIVNYNDAEDTVRYVKKIREYANIQRIVIVDNLSTESNILKKLEEAKNEKVVILQSDKNGGYSYGNNFGIRYLEEQKEAYDYLMISNPDIEVEETAIQRCLEVLQENQKIAIAAPRMYQAQNVPIRRSSWKTRTFWRDVIHSTRILEALFYPKLREGEYGQKEYATQSLLPVDVISGAFFIVKYDVFHQIGQFDENVFLFYEEDILAQKMREKNYQIVSVNDVKCIHHESQTIGKTMNYYRKIKELQKSKMYYHKKYNHINKMQELLFQILNIFRRIELIIELPIRKIGKK